MWYFFSTSITQLIENKRKEPPVGCTKYLSAFFILLRNLLSFMFKYCTYENNITRLITLRVLFLVPETIISSIFSNVCHIENISNKSLKSKLDRHII
jgi:hypothetical protein